MKRQVKQPLVVKDRLELATPAATRAEAIEAGVAKMQPPPPSKQRQTNPRKPMYGDKLEQDYYAARMGLMVKVLTVLPGHTALRGRLLWRDTYNICILPTEGPDSILLSKSSIVYVHSLDPVPTAAAPEGEKKHIHQDTV